MSERPHFTPPYIYVGLFRDEEASRAGEDAETEDVFAGARDGLQDLRLQDASLQSQLAAASAFGRPYETSRATALMLGFMQGALAAFRPRF